MKTATKTRKTRRAGLAPSPVRNASEKVIRCEVDMTLNRRIRCDSGGGFFCFEFKSGKRIQRVKLTDEAAWMVREMIDSTHPRIAGSSNPLWHKVQAMRKGNTIPNTTMSCTAPKEKL